MLTILIFFFVYCISMLQQQHRMVRRRLFVLFPLLCGFTLVTVVFLLVFDIPSTETHPIFIYGTYSIVNGVKVYYKVIGFISEQMLHWCSIRVEQTAIKLAPVKIYPIGYETSLCNLID